MYEFMDQANAYERGLQDGQAFLQQMTEVGLTKLEFLADARVEAGYKYGVTMPSIVDRYAAGQSDAWDQWHKAVNA